MRRFQEDPINFGWWNVEGELGKLCSNPVIIQLILAIGNIDFDSLR